MLMTKGTEVINANEAKFTQVMEGVSKSSLWGDAEGKHGSFTRLKAGLTTPLHTHTYDIRMIVVSGTLIHTEPDGIVTRLGPGSYCFTPGGSVHSTGCTADADCLFYEEQDGKFDLKPVR